MRQRKKRMRTRTKFVIISLTSVIIYTAVVLWLSSMDHSVPAELTVAFFTFFGTELGLLAGLKLRDKEDSNNGN